MELTDYKTIVLKKDIIIGILKLQVKILESLIENRMPDLETQLLVEDVLSILNREN